MNGTAQASSFYIGWDVGGWNCDKNGKSRDALVILDTRLNIVGKPWRGNLRAVINDAGDSADWIKHLFALCDAITPSQAKITLAIDTPLGFSDAFVRLVTQRHHAGKVSRSNTNPYLFRQTERFLFECGLKPLSAIKDMIGSQTTKGCTSSPNSSATISVVGYGLMVSGSPPSKPILPPANAPPPCSN